MSDVEVRVLIVEKGLETGASLVAALFPELVVTGFEVRRTLHLAFQELRESDFDICFISEDFADADIEAFFADVKQAAKYSDSLFIKLMKTFPEGFVRESVKVAGFLDVIRRPPTESDKIMLRTEAQRFLKEREIVRKCVDVDTAVKLILRELDRVAIDRKRGIERKFAMNIVSNFMTDQVHSHQEVLAALIEALAKHAENAEPDKELKVVLPSHLFDQSLPGLENNTYVGTSHRVWAMLRDKFGVEIDEKEEEKISSKKESSDTPE